MYFRKRVFTRSPVHPKQPDDIRRNGRNESRIADGGMDEMKAGIQCRGMDIRKGRDVDVRNGREMVAGLNRKREDLTSP